jgi:hypothetical protein
MKIEEILRKKLFLRRGEIRQDLGVTDEEISKMVRGNVLKPVYLCDEARPKKCKGKGIAHAYFVREQVIQALNGIVERAKS